jgi:7-cyano-7-deazaguanine reductase
MSSVPLWVPFRSYYCARKDASERAEGPPSPVASTPSAEPGSPGGEYIGAMAQLEVFDNPKPERDYVIRHVCPEFTSVCPKTGNPDFGTITVEYVPDRLCVELKSLKLYFFAFRDKGVFYEAAVNQILDDLVAVCRPRRMTVTGEFNVRGGISSVVTAAYGPQE